MSARRLLLLLPALLPLLAAASAPAADPGNAGGKILRLDERASFQHGCFDPCLCPLGPVLPVRGVFVLGPAVIGDVVNFHEITDVYWRAGDGDQALHTITGSGSYRITNFGDERRHALDLQLSVDGAPAQAFFSDFVPIDGGASFFDIPVSVNGVYCLDTLIRVSARPVPPIEVTRYALRRGSTYQQGCFDPCDCLLEPRRPLRGRFDLIPLGDAGTYREFAIARARFFAPGGADTADALLRLTGAGHYLLIQGFAGPAHAMELELGLDGGPPERFDQELSNTAATFPSIRIQLDTSELVCFDRVLRLRAEPLRSLAD